MINDDVVAFIAGNVYIFPSSGIPTVPNLIPSLALDPPQPGDLQPHGNNDCEGASVR